MAFGKDTSRLGKVPAFGGATLQQRAQWQRDRSRSQRTGGFRRFSEEYKPPMQPAMDLGRLIPGNYKIALPADDAGSSTMEMEYEYMTFLEHFDGRTDRSSICSGGPLHNFKGKRAACRGCDLFYEPGQSADGKKAKKRMSKRDMFVFNWLHYVQYHKIESVDQNNGQIRVNTSTNEPYYDWVPCEGRTCTACKANKETTQGRLRPWVMGYSHFTMLIDTYNPLIGTSCAGCGTKDSIATVAWTCTADGCGEAMFELDGPNATSLSDADLAKVVLRPVICPTCTNQVVLQEVYGCANCQSPRRATIFDVDLNVQRANISQAGDNKTQLVVTSWTNPRPIDQRFAGACEKPLALDRMFQGTSIEVQEKLFELQGTQPVVNSAFRQYGPAGGGTPGGSAPSGSTPNYG